MAPRQRIASPPSQEDLRSVSPITTSEPTKPLVQGAIVPPKDATDTARERHDFFNLVALVS